MGGMVVNKRGLRLSRFIVELRNKRYPNAKSFAELLRKIDLDENIDIACDQRTVQRDIKALRRLYDAPLGYDKLEEGYYLKDPGWTFAGPIFTEDFTLSTMLGASLAKNMIPKPIKNNIENAVNDHLATNCPDFLDRDFIDSLLVAAGTKADVNPDVFKVVFDGWKLRQVIDIVHRRPDGAESSRRFEPHVLAYHKGIWYVKGRCLLKQETRVFAIHRLVSATLTYQEFVQDNDMVEAVERNGLFDYPKLKNVKVHCDPSICGWIREQASAKKLILENQPDGSLLVTMPEAYEHEALRWVLGEGGKVKILEPISLARKALAAGHELVKAHESAGTQPIQLKQPPI